MSMLEVESSRLLASIWSANHGALQLSYATCALGRHQTQALCSLPKLHCIVTRTQSKLEPCAFDSVPSAAKHGPRAPTSLRFSDSGFTSQATGDTTKVHCSPRFKDAEWIVGELAVDNEHELKFVE
jgi:hypothetical protein